jgi:hypothetical protein
MSSLVYENTKFTVPGWVPFNDKEPRGIAYETSTHFVHFYGKDFGLRVISAGLTVTEAKAKAKAASLEDWIQDAFGATDILPSANEPGHTIEGVWRPGLYFEDELLQGLGVTSPELRLAEQSLLLLLQRLDEVLLFIEPSVQSLETYSHKTRELLILACTEVESSWKHYLRRAGVQEPSNGFTTKHYVRLKEPLFLEEFEVILPRYSSIPQQQPFSGWSATNPTTSLDWYNAYNKTKHDRTIHFASASLLNCLKATAANIVLFAVRFGPFRLFSGGGTLSAMFNQTFSIGLKQPNYQSFYAPLISLPVNQRVDRICFNSRELTQPRTVCPFLI